MSYRRQAEHHPLCSCEELSALELDFRKQGTRFRLFPQSPLLGDYQEPETVWISLSPDEIMPGPSDDRMYVADAIGKSHYDDAFLPPYSGPQNQPAMAAEDGHFDHIEVGTEQFEAAHMYGTLRWVLDIWETYFERKIDWSFNEHFERLELVPWLDWDNAHAGYGFIEMGYGSDDRSAYSDLCAQALDASSTISPSNTTKVCHPEPLPLSAYTYSIGCMNRSCNRLWVTLMQSPVC